MPGAIAALEAADDNIVSEILSKHAHSQQPESKQLVAMLLALKEVVQEQGLAVTPTALFAAVMTACEKEETLASAEVVLSMCSILGYILPRIPNGVIRTRYNSSLLILRTIVQKYSSQAAPVKAALPCLAHFLAAVDPDEWLSASASFMMLLSFTTDARPKVRRRAQAGVMEVLGALQQQQATLTQASDMVAKVSTQVLQGPEASARKAAAASNKQRPEAEEAMTKAVADALHFLATLKQALPLLTGAAVKVVCEAVFPLYPLKQSLLSRSASEVLSALCASPSARITAPTLIQLLQVVMQQEQLWTARDVDTASSAISMLERGFTKLHSLDAALCSQHLPTAFNLMVPQLGAEADGVRFQASQSLTSLIKQCLDSQVIGAAVAASSSLAGSSQKLPAANRIIAAVCSGMSVRYQDAWSLALPVVGTLMEQLGHHGAPLATPLLTQLDTILAGAADAAEDAAAESRLAGSTPGEGPAPYEAAAAAAMGSALRSLGPEVVLSVLPLNLREGIDGTGEARTWLLPMLKKYVKGTKLSYWTTNLLPLAKQLGGRAVKAQEANQRTLATNCLLLEGQLWSALPAFCSWATDTAQVYPSLARELGAAFSNRADLRASICAALQRLCLQNRYALQQQGVKEVPGFSEPFGQGSSGNEDDEEEGRGDSDALDAAGGVPESYTAQVAGANLKSLQSFAQNWLPLMFKTILELDPEERAPVTAAASAYCCVTPPNLLGGLFRTVITKMIKIMDDAKKELPPPDLITEGGADPTQRWCSFLELGLCCAPGLPDQGIATLVKAALPGLQDPQAAAQKKAYKVLAYICEYRQPYLKANLSTVLQAVLLGGVTSASASRRFRLRCLKPLVLMLTSADCPEIQLEGEEFEGLDDAQKKQQVVASVITEMVLSTKESNVKTRTAAYNMVVQVAHAMHDAFPPTPLSLMDDPMDESSLNRGGLHQVFTMILAGLAGTTPHMISASVMALARLIYEFASQLGPLVPDLLPPVLSLLCTKSREVVKSVLGFVKVCAVRLPVEMLTQQLGPIMEGLLLWAEDSKNKFKLKVRTIVERLCKRCGFDEVQKHMPEQDSKLLTSIRKEHNQKMKRKARFMEGSQGSEGDPDEHDRRSRANTQTTMARTAKASDWEHSNIFSDDEDGDGKTVAGVKRAKSEYGKSVAGRSRVTSVSGRGGRVSVLRDSGDDPMNLLDPSTSRHLSKSAAGVGTQAAEVDDFVRDDKGKMIIREEEDPFATKWTKRKRDNGYDSDDSDFDDLKGIAGLDKAMRDAAKSVHFAKSVKSNAGRSTVGGKSMAATSRAASVKSGGPGSHSGDRFKPKKGNTGGDKKGSSKVDPYSYWKFDRTMLNNRRGKSKQASKHLATVVNAAKAGAPKGKKAKKQRTT